MNVNIRKFAAVVPLSSQWPFALARTGRIDNIAEARSPRFRIRCERPKGAGQTPAFCRTVAVGLFIRGGARNINAKNAGIENLTLTATVEAGTKFPRAIQCGANSRGRAVRSAQVRGKISALSRLPRRARILTACGTCLPTSRSARPSHPKISNAYASDAGRPPRGANRSRRPLQAAARRAIIYAGHPYANDVTGSVATIGSLTAADSCIP